MILIFHIQDTGSLGSSHSSGSRRSSGGSPSRPNVHRQRTPEEQTLVGMLEAVFAVMEEPKGTVVSSKNLAPLII